MYYYYYYYYDVLFLIKCRLGNSMLLVLRSIVGGNITCQIPTCINYIVSSSSSSSSTTTTTTSTTTSTTTTTTTTTATTTASIHMHVYVYIYIYIHTHTHTHARMFARGGRASEGSVDGRRVRHRAGGALAVVEPVPRSLL